MPVPSEAGKRLPDDTKTTTLNVAGGPIELPVTALDGPLEVVGDRIVGLVERQIFAAPLRDLLPRRSDSQHRAVPRGHRDRSGLGGRACAVSHLGMGEDELALSRLEQAGRQSRGRVIFTWSKPFWAGLADHSRFKALGERIGLWN